METSAIGGRFSKGNSFGPWAGDELLKENRQFALIRPGRSGIQPGREGAQDSALTSASSTFALHPLPHHGNLQAHEVYFS